MDPNYKEFCYSLARKAGEIMTDVFSKGVKREWKENRTPVTVADTKINSLVIERINKEFPEYDVIGEEESSISNNGAYVWVCDPLDGTFPFSHGVPTAVFSLALVKDGIPILGVIYDPWSDRMYYAEKGKGALLNDEPISVNDNTDLGRKILGVEAWKGARYDLSRAYALLIEKDAILINTGSTVYISMLVASGEFTGFLFPGYTCYDGAAIKIIVEEAGGKVTDLYGEEQRYDSDLKGMIISNGKVHEELLELVSKILT